ncbi:MAG TPA: hypothetical protein VMV80_05485, partial [Anaerolineales bacterium]|nr:hypothetical protein [Anaerolineales bacterium]
HSDPVASGLCTCHNTVEVERIGSHLYPSILVFPFCQRAVAVDLYPVPIGVGEVNRLTHQVVGEALDGGFTFDQAAQETAQFPAGWN